jgi:hypothetical protein
MGFLKDRLPSPSDRMADVHSHRQGPGMDRRYPVRPQSSFAEIAEREAQGERHIRLLAPLAFLSPCESWSRYTSAAGFVGITHYYRPDGVPREQQPWLASVWRRWAP